MSIQNKFGLFSSAPTQNNDVIPKEEIEKWRAEIEKLSAAVISMVKLKNDDAILKTAQSLNFFGDTFHKLHELVSKPDLVNKADAEQQYNSAPRFKM